MASDLPGFSTAQWDFLAVLEALENPLPIDIVGHARSADRLALCLI